MREVQVGELDVLGRAWKFWANASPPSPLYTQTLHLVVSVISFIIKLLWKIYAFLSFELLDCGRVYRRWGLRLSKFIIQPGRSGGKLGTHFAAHI